MQVHAQRGQDVRSKLAACVVLMLVALSTPARADEFEEGGVLYAIQPRHQVVGHEFTLGMGTVPLDAFYKGLTGTFAYSYHFTSTWAWEIVSFTYSANFWTNRKDELEQNWKVKPVNISKLNYMGDSDLIFKPLAGKFAVFNRKLIYGEVFFAVGPAIAKYTVPGAYFGGNVGMGFRIRLSKFFSTRLDMRYYRFQRLEIGKLGDNDDVLFLQLGLSLNIH